MASSLADNGQPMPAELITRLSRPDSDHRRDLVLIKPGDGLSICLAQIEMPAAFGLIRLFMGISFLLVWKLESGKGGDA